MRHPIEHLPRLAALCTAAALITACATERNYRLVDDAAAAQTATLTVPYQITVESLDGRALNDGYLFYDQRPQVLTLPAGEHRMELRYFDMVAESDDPRADTERVVSDPLTLRFTAEPGGQYRLKAPQPTTLAAARAYARDPSLRIEAVAGGEAVATSTSEDGNRGAEDVGKPLNMLEFWWQKADDDQRRRFLERHGS